MGTRSKVALAVSAAVLALAGPAVSASAATGASAVDPVRAAVDSAVNAYLASYPQLTPAQARAAALGQENRKAVVVEMLGRQDDSFGGAWFDPPTGILHVSATNASAVEQAQQVARGNGVKLTTHLVTRSFNELQRRADALRGGEGVLGQAAKGHVGIDVTTNEVTVALPAAQLSTLASVSTSAATEGVKLVTDPGLKVQKDNGCTSRKACDQTIRAGAIIIRPEPGGATGKACSAGFTARNPSGQRIVYSAGHCHSTDLLVKWTTGSELIGSEMFAVDSGNVDVMPILVTNTWFKGDTGGEIYLQGSTFLPVNGVAPTLGFIMPGEAVCLSANYDLPTGVNECGTVGTTSDAAMRGMVRVDGVDACEGDSGGGWYWFPNSGRPQAYGIHSTSDPGCHGSIPSPDGQTSWFTAVPLAKAAVAPNYDIEVR